MKLSVKEKAQLMMFKMGWKGKGLGKNEQGRRTPLMVRRTSETQGVIYSETLEEREVANPSPILRISNVIASDSLNADSVREITDEINKMAQIKVCS